MDTGARNVSAAYALLLMKTSKIIPHIDGICQLYVELCLVHVHVYRDINISIFVFEFCLTIHTKKCNSQQQYYVLS